MAELSALWIGDGTADTVVAAKRRAAREANVLARRILDGFPLETRTTGFFCWLKLPDQDASLELTSAARQRGIIVADTSYFATGGAVSEAGVRIALGLKEQKVLIGALECLARLLQQG